MTNVSTGEPDNQWKAWGKWLRLFGVVAAGTWLLRVSDQHIVVVLGLAAIVAVMCVRLRLTEQRLDLLVDGRPVQLNLYTDMFRRVWLESRSAGTLVRTCIMHSYQQGWRDHVLGLGGRQYSLRVLVRPYGDGYLVSNQGRGFDMVVLRNSCAW